MHEEVVVRHAGLQPLQRNAPHCKPPAAPTRPLIEGRPRLPQLVPIQPSARDITDEASPLALRSTRNRPRTAMHRRCLSLVVEGCRDDGAGVRAIDDHAGILARELPETAPHATSRPHTTPPSAARLTSVIARGREVTRGGTNHPSINGMQGVSSTARAQSLDQSPCIGTTSIRACLLAGREASAWRLAH